MPTPTAEVVSRAAPTTPATPTPTTATTATTATVVARRSLRILETVDIAAPCPADWSAMRPVSGDRVRHCGACDLNVHNLSGMTRGAAEAMLARHAEACADARAVDAAVPRLCVRLYRRPDGTVLTQDCGVVRRLASRAASAGVAGARRAAWWATCAVAGIVGATALVARSIDENRAASPGNSATMGRSSLTSGLPPLVRRGLEHMAEFGPLGRVLDLLCPPPPGAVVGMRAVAGDIAPPPLKMGEMMQGDIAPPAIPPVWVGVP